MSIENSHTSLLAGSRAEDLETILRLSTGLHISLDLDHTLRSACKLIVELVGVSHSHIVLFGQSSIVDEVHAEYPEIGTGVTALLRRWMAEDGEHDHFRKAVVIHDTASNPSLKHSRDSFLNLGINSILVMPLVSNDRMLGYFSLVTIGYTYTFTRKEIDLCRIFATQLAVAIENALIFRETTRRAKQLETLRHTALAITSKVGRDKLLSEIIEQAVGLLGARSGGIYQYYPEREELTVIVDCNRPEREGTTLKVGEGMAGRLVESGQQFLIVDDYNEWPYKSVAAGQPRAFGAVLEVPLIWQDETIGVIYIEDALGRKFTEEDAHLLGLFADHASIALINSELITKDANLVEELSKQKNFLERLIESSPNGVIVVDARGGVAGFNKQSEEILGYTTDEMVGRMVWPLFGDRYEARRIVRKLRGSPDGRLSGYETTLINKKEERVPVRVSATWLYDVRREHVGVIVYFEDLTSIKETESRLTHLLKAGDIVIRANDLTEGLHRLVEMMVSLLQVSFCRIMLMDESLESFVANAAYPIVRSDHQLQWNPRIGERLELSEWPGLKIILDKGAPRVFRWSDGRSQVALRSLSSLLGLRRDIQSLLVIPLKIENRVVGFIDLGELRDEKRSAFSDEKIDLASAIATHITTLIDRMQLYEATKRRDRELDRLNQAAKDFSGEFDLKSLLLRIVDTAREMLGGSSATIWPFDEGLKKFVPEELVTVGIPEYILPEFQELEPKPGGSTYSVTKRGWLGVPDILTSEEEFLKGPRRELLLRMDVKSFQGIVLKVGDETVGVLYVNYSQPHTFIEEDKSLLRNLAAHAAVSLKKARLLHQLTSVNRMAEAIAQVTVEGERQKTLNAVVKATRDAVGCDAVTLYVFNQTANEFDHPAIMKGVIDPGRASRSKAQLDSIVYRMLEHDEPYPVPHIGNDPYFKDTAFAKAEKIKACLAIPLKVVGRKVGVMFVNYRAQHRFTPDELSRIKLFANQAAVAIRNHQLFAELKSKLSEQQSLIDLSKKFIRTGGVQAILDSAVALAAKKLNTACCNIVLPDSRGDLVFVAEVGWVGIELWKTKMGRETESQTGLTIKDKKPIRVLDYKCKEDISFTVPQIVLDNDLVSGVSVPMFSGKEVIGAMLVHTKEPRFFDKSEIDFLSLIANQTAIAIKSAQRFEELQRQSKYLEALHEAGKVITRSFGLEQTEVLEKIVEQAIKCLIVDQDGRRGFGTIQLYDEHEDELEFVSFYSPEESPRLRYRIGDRRKLGAGKKGLTARAVRTLEPQLVNNVRASEDYHEFDSRTRSELDAPLVENGRPLGVLNIEGFEFTTFDDLDLKILQALAELAVIAIQNGRQLEVIRRTQGLVAASTAVAWIGMASSVWGHGMRNTAITIRNLVTLLRDDLVRMTIDAESHEVIENKLLSISKLAENIFNRRITVPLSSEEGVVSIPIKDWLIGWEDRLREYRYHEGVSLILDLETCADVKVRCDPIWMTEVLDILFENAIAAVGTMPAPSLMLSAHVANDKVEIAVTDNGPGIPPDVRNILFKEPVRKSANDRGTGVGLLMARVIAQAYGGEVGVKSTGPEGTTMVIQLPVEH